MSCYVIQNPVPEQWRQEFDILDLTNTTQERFTCPQACGVVYVLIYPTAAGAQLLEQYRHHVEAHLGGCGHHPGRMIINE